MRLRILLAAAIVPFIMGCGSGSGSGNSSTIPVHVNLHWAARSRVVNAPSSALSAVFTLTQGGSDGSGSDMTFTINRHADPGDYAEAVVSPNTTRAGSSILAVRFHTQPNGVGGVVAIANVAVIVRPDGTMTKPDGTPLGDIETVGTISNIEVAAVQQVTVGQDQSLEWTATDIQGNIVALSPGSVFITVSAGSDFLSVNSNGTVHGLAKGLASVTVKVDSTTSPPQQVNVTTPMTLRRLNLATNDIGYDPKSGKLYASVPGNNSQGYANCIVAIDPASAAVTNKVFVGSEPNRIAISDDGQFLYVGLDGAGAVRRVKLDTLTADIQFSLGADPNLGPRLCGDIAVMPGSPQTAAISMVGPRYFPSFISLVIFDDGVPRAKALTRVDIVGANSIGFGSANSRLFGIDTWISNIFISRITVDNSGLSLVDSKPDLLRWYTNVRMFDGKVYSSFGQAADPETFTLTGQFPLGLDQYGTAQTNGFTVDSVGGKAYYMVSVNSNSYFWLYEFDKSKFLNLSTHILQFPTDETERNAIPRMVNCSGGVLAFNTRGGQHPELGQVVVVTLGQ